MIKIGVARKIISPKVGCLLAGYPTESRASHIEDDLKLTAIVIESEKEKVVLISMDVISTCYKLFDFYKQEIKKLTGIENVIIFATHTHTGPRVLEEEGWGKIDWDFVDNVLTPRLLEAVKEANAKTEEVVVGIGCYDDCEVGVNRREIKNGKSHLGENPDGILNRKMYVVSFKNLKDKILCNMIHYGAHGTSWIGNYFVSRDWMGIANDMLEEHSGAITFFANGAEGDIGHRKTDRKTGEKIMPKELGKRGGEDAIKAFNNIEEYKEVELKIINDEIKLPYDELFPLELAKAKVEEMSNVNIYQEKKLELAAWKEIIKAHGEEKKTHRTHKQIIIAIGDIALVPTSYEIFCEIAMNLAEKSPFKYTLAITNANGEDGYMPTEKAIALGGYECWNFKHRSAYVLTDDVDTKFVEENLRILNKLKSL